MSERKPFEVDDTQDNDEGGAPPPPVSFRVQTGWRRRASTRSRIVEAALKIYAEKGAEAPVIEDFVKAAGVSRGSFYNHFTTTAELLEATIECFANELARRIIDAIEPSDDVVANAATAMRMHLRSVTTDPTICAFFAKIPQVGEAGRRHAQTQYQRGVASGAFVDVDQDAANDLLFGTLHETVRRVARAPGRPMRLDEVVARVLAGLGVAPAKITEVMALPLPVVQLPVQKTGAGTTGRG